MARNTGQRIPWFDRCQLSITWVSNIRQIRCKLRRYVSVNLLAGVWPPSSYLSKYSDKFMHSIVLYKNAMHKFVRVLDNPHHLGRLHCRRWAIPLAMITMRIHGFPLLSYMSMVLRLTASRPPEHRYNHGHCVVLRQDTLLSQCLSPHRCING